MQSVVFLLLFCEVLAMNREAVAHSATPAENSSLVQADNQFAVDLYRQLAKEHQGKNLFFSPYSMSNALAMTAEGARGETAQQMGKTLCFPASARNVGSDAEVRPWNMALIHASMSALNERFNPKPVPKELRTKIAALRVRLDAVNQAAQAEQDWRKQTALARESQTLAAELNKLLPQVDQYELRVANTLWGEKTYPFQPSYLETIHRFYRSGGAFPANFKGNAEGERQKINAWVEDQTNKRIRDLIPPGCLDEQTRLVLTNAIYFKGQWSEPFEEGATMEEDFVVAVGDKRACR